MGSGADRGGDLQLHSAAGCCVLNEKLHSGYRAQELCFWGGAFKGLLCTSLNTL